MFFSRRSGDLIRYVTFLLERRITDQMDANEVAFVQYVYVVLIGSEMCSVLLF